METREDCLSVLRPHDLLRLSPKAVDLLPADAPAWTRESLRTVPWVVVRRAVTPDGLIPVGIRGVVRAQRYAWSVMSDLVQERVTPEDLAPVEPAPGRGVAALLTLAAVRSALRDTDLDWGPTGSVGFELATGTPTATEVSDLDLIVRACDVNCSVVSQLPTLHRHLVGLNAPVDCQVETRMGAVALAELVSDSSHALMKTATGPRLIKRAAAVS